MDGVCETAFKVGDRCEAIFQKMLVHGGKIFVMFSELACTDSDEIMCLEMVNNFGNHKHSFSDVKRKEGLGTMRHVVWRVAYQLSSSDAICPKDMMSKRRPLSDITVASLHEGVTDGAVRLFDNAIGLRVVCRDADMMDVVFFGEPIKGGNKGYSVVSDDLFKSSPSA